MINLTYFYLTDAEIWDTTEAIRFVLTYFWRDRK